MCLDNNNKEVKINFKISSPSPIFSRVLRVDWEGLGLRECRASRHTESWLEEGLGWLLNTSTALLVTETWEPTLALSSQ